MITIQELLYNKGVKKGVNLVRNKDSRQNLLITKK